MKLKEEFVKLSKDTVYDMYLSIVYNTKDYDNISRSKMLDDILLEYNQGNYLYYICTRRELDFLKFIKDKEITEEIMIKYGWEIRELNRKCIFSRVDFKVFDEQADNVKDALDYYEFHKDRTDDLFILMISLVRINGEMLTDVLINLVSSISKNVFNTGVDDLKKLLGHPLVHFYLEFNSDYSDDLGEVETVLYRDYYALLDEMREKRREFGMVGGREVYYKDNFDMFYYGCNISNKKVKKMYDEVSKLINSEIVFKFIDEARVLNNRYMIDIMVKDEKLKNIINDALDCMPCAVMNGFTPNERMTELEEESLLDYKFSVIPQNNAHLCKNAADLFYKLYFGLLDYVNKKEHINLKLEKIYKQEGLDVRELYQIDNYLWEHKEEIIDEFVKVNPKEFNDEELEMIKGFKSAVTSNNFVVVGFDNDYTKILDLETNKLYMVKGIRSNIDEILDDYNNLPKVVATTLLMFDGKIVFNSFLSSYQISFGNDFKKLIVKGLDKAMKCYHL